MNENSDDRLYPTALALTTALLFAFATAFFLYFGLNTLNDGVFSIDFVPYHLAGRLLAQGDLEPLSNYEASGGFFATSGPFLDYFHEFFYPDSPYATRWVYLPGYLWIFRPLASLDFPAASRVWLAINALLTLAGFWLLWSTRRLPALSGRLKTWRLAWFAFLVLTFQPMLSNLWHGQVTALIFACFCLSFWLLHRDRSLAAGVVLGLIVPFKFYPALFVLYFVWRRNWRFVAGTFAGTLAILLISLLTVGWDANVAYFRVVISELGGGGIPAFNNESISGFLMHAFTEGDVFSWLDIEVPFWLTAIRVALVLLIIGAVLLAIRRQPSATTNAVFAQDLDLALVIFIMLLVSPITWYHTYMWLLLPLTILFDYFLLAPRLNGRHIVWLAVAYGLIVFQGVIVLRPLAARSLQDVWLLRLLLSQSFFGAALLLGLTLKLRLQDR
jgi:hypothetical protein